MRHLVRLLPQRGHELGQLRLGLEQLDPLGLDGLEDLGVEVDGPDPHAHGAAGLGRLGHLVGDEAGVVDVATDPFTHLNSETLLLQKEDIFFKDVMVF